MKPLNRLKWIIITLGYVSIIFLLSFRSQSSIKKPLIIEVLYNCAHIPLYGILGYFLIILFKYLRSGKMAVIYTIACGVTVGFTDEFFQSFVPGRTSSLMDIGLDLTGICMGMLIFKILRINAKKQMKLGETEGVL